MRLLPVLLLLSCAHHAAPVSVDVPAGLHAAAGVVRALHPADRAGCVTLAAIGTAIDAAADAYGQRLPDVWVDVGSCGLALEPVDVGAAGELVAPALVAVDALVGGVHQECARAWLVAAVSYVSGAWPAILDELAHPDGIVDVPGVDAPACAAP